MLCLENVLNESHVSAFVKVLDEPSLFERGTSTAGRVARAQKHNLQAIEDKPEIKRVISEIRSALSQHTMFQRFAVPFKVGRIRISRCEAGMEYGVHFDNAFIEGVRTDLSFTLFLSSPDTYIGGEIELQSSMGAQAIKLPAGCALVYPSDHLHAVRPVETGTRLAAIGWVQSRVRSVTHRQLLFDLAQATELISNAETRDEQMDAAITQLKYVRNNLVRLWGD